MKYQPPFDPAYAGNPVDGIYNADPDASYVNGNPATDTEGSIPPMEAVMHPMLEIINLIESTGLVPSHTDLEQLRKAVRRMIGGDDVIAHMGRKVPIYKGVDDYVHQVHSITGRNGVSVYLEGDVIVVDGAGAGGQTGGSGSGGAGTGLSCVALPTGIRGPLISSHTQHGQVSSGVIYTFPGYSTSGAVNTLYDGLDNGTFIQPVAVNDIFYQDFGTKRLIDSVEAFSDYGIVDATLTAGSLVVSDDATTWTAIVSRTGIGPNQLVTWTSPPTQTCYRYWGIRVDALSSIVNQWQASDLRFYERVLP